MLFRRSFTFVLLSGRVGDRFCGIRLVRRDGFWHDAHELSVAQVSRGSHLRRRLLNPEPKIRMKRRVQATNHHSLEWDDRDINRIHMLFLSFSFPRHVYTLPTALFNGSFLLFFHVSKFSFLSFSFPRTIVDFRHDGNNLGEIQQRGMLTLKKMKWIKKSQKSAFCRQIFFLHSGSWNINSRENWNKQFRSTRMDMAVASFMNEKKKKEKGARSVRQRNQFPPRGWFLHPFKTLRAIFFSIRIYFRGHHQF